MYVCEIYNRGNEVWQKSQSIEPQERFDAMQKRVVEQAVECQYRILRDGVQVASWEPSQGWRYWRTAAEVVTWCNSSRNWEENNSAVRKWFEQQMGEQWKDESWWLLELTGLKSVQGRMNSEPDFNEAVNKFFDARGLLLPDGALPPGLLQVDKPLRTPADIAAWCRDHFENQDVRKAIVDTQLKSALDDDSDMIHPSRYPEACWEGCFGDDSDRHFLLVRDLAKYPDLHRELSRIIDEYVEPAPQSYPPEFVRVPRPVPQSYSAEEVIAWLKKELWEGYHAQHGEKYEQFAIDQTAMEVEMFGKTLRRGKDAKELRTNPAYLAAVCALLDKHDINIRKETTMKTGRKARVEKGAVYAELHPNDCGGVELHKTNMRCGESYSIDYWRRVVKAINIAIGDEQPDDAVVNV